jgi:hypothetical protein
VQADHVAFAVVNEGDVAVLADGKFGFVDFASVLRGALGFDGAIGCVEVNDGPAHFRFDPGHVNESARTSGRGVMHGEREHFDNWAREFGELNFENSFVKFLGAVHVLDVNLKPSDDVVVIHMSPLLERFTPENAESKLAEFQFKN